MRQGKRAGATKGMAREKRNSRIRKVKNRVEHRIEPVTVGKCVSITFIQIEARTPEFGVAAASDDRSSSVGSDGCLDMVEDAGDSLAEGDIKPVLGLLPQCDDEDTALAREGQVREVGRW